MPEMIDTAMFSPCGMNCMVCSVHLKKKKPCKGCLFDDTDKTERCRICEIKKCAKEKGSIYCFTCTDFPCKSISDLDKNYQRRYHVSLIDNCTMIKTYGFDHFFKTEQEKWHCSICEGVISLHDKECSECGKKVNSSAINKCNNA